MPTLPANRGGRSRIALASLCLALCAAVSGCAAEPHIETTITYSFGNYPTLKLALEPGGMARVVDLPAAAATACIEPTGWTGSDLFSGSAQWGFASDDRIRLSARDWEFFLAYDWERGSPALSTLYFPLCPDPAPGQYIVLYAG